MGIVRANGGTRWLGDRTRAWMDRAQQRVEQFLGKWLGSEGNERANYQGFFIDLCEVVGFDALC